MNFRELHWGKGAAGTRRMRTLVGPTTSLGKLKAISYAAWKGGENGNAVYRHEFEHQPRLLVSDSAGEISLPDDVPDDLLAIGRLIDLEMAEDETRWAAPAGVYVATTEDGDHLWIVSRDGCEYAIERMAANYVTVDGIEG